ncbi:hypothetical protein [Raineyella fluvialis]|uniref:hypothetical protein n=1 Tax=Raineyella fluvialis TaxID=2662261 RepID=UPI001E448F06|nr:hypothetical protein [Raineyella fluvialis]
MATSDAIVDVEDWISEHFFTAEAKGESFQQKVLIRRKEWEELDGPDGSPRSRFTSSRSKLLDALTALYTDGNTDPATTAQRITDLYRDLRTILGYATGEFHIEQSGPVRFYNTLGVTADAPFVIIGAKPVDALDELLPKDQKTLLCPFPISEKDELTSVSRTLSHLFVREDGPQFALVMAGRWLVVAERSRWPEGRYLAVDLQTVADRNDAKRGGEIDKALTCLAADSLAPDADGAIWWTKILEESIKHTVGVSQDLREGVRLSVELIANDVVQRRKAKGLPHCRPTRPSRWPASRCGSSTGSCSCCTPRPPPSSACCRSAHRSTRTATAWTGCATSPWLSSAPRTPAPAPTCTTRSACCSGWSTRATTRQPPTPIRTRGQAPRGWSSTACAPTCSSRRRSNTSAR